MVRIGDIKLVAYLQMRGINFTTFEREGSRKYFIYKESQEEIDKYISDYYKSEVSEFFGYFESLKTLALRC